MILPTVMAMNVISRGDGKVFIQEAISAMGTEPEISFTQVMPGGRTVSVALADAKDIQVERRGRDIILTGFPRDGRYQDVLIQRKEQGNQQTIRISLSGNARSSSVQSHSASAFPGNRPVPGPFSGPDVRRRGPVAAPPHLGQSIVNQRFENKEMSGANFRLASIVNARFEHVNLAGADFSQANLVNVRYQESDLSRVDFRQSHFVNIRFQRVNLQGANFRGANLTGVDFGDADLSGAIWTDGQRCLPGSIGQCRFQ